MTHLCIKDGHSERTIIAFVPVDFITICRGDLQWEPISGFHEYSKEKGYRGITENWEVTRWVYCSGPFLTRQDHLVSSKEESVKGLVLQNRKKERKYRQRGGMKENKCINKQATEEQEPWWLVERGGGRDHAADLHLHVVSTPSLFPLSGSAKPTGGNYVERRRREERSGGGRTVCSPLH